MALSPGIDVGPYRVIDKLGEGGPPSLAHSRELRRGLAVAQART
jgi:hypothetical protein